MQGAQPQTMSDSGFKCELCGQPVDPYSRYTWHRVIGWERKGAAGGSDIALREKRDGWAHPHCVSMAQQGHSVWQQKIV